MSRSPSGLPALGRGRHRSARRGACFMEYASVLAGERWSDAPACTAPSLGVLARAVNDCSSDAGRQQLVLLVPDAVGAWGDGDDVALGLRLARRAVLAALEHAKGTRRRTLSVALLGVLLADQREHRPADRDDEAADQQVRAPDSAMRWAAAFLARHPEGSAADRDSVSASIELAVLTVSEGPDGDSRLRALLADAIGLAARRPEPAGHATSRPAYATL